MNIPNIPDSKVPEGNSENENIEILKNEVDIDENQKLKPHWELIKDFNLIDFENGNKITGAGFPIYTNKGAKLQRALINYFLDEAEKNIQELLKNFSYGDMCLEDIEDRLFEIKGLSRKHNVFADELISLKTELEKDLHEFDNFDEEIIILENIRFYAEEEQNDNEFAKHLASLGDIYVNDAFSCSHRLHASIHQISKFLPSFSGLQLDLEINALNRITTKIIKPITCIIGGSKISTKINIIKNLIPKFDNIIIVGAMANNFIEYFGHNIGKSIKEKNCDTIIEEIISLSKKEKFNIKEKGDPFEASGAGKDKVKAILGHKCDLILGRYKVKKHPFILLDMQHINDTLMQEKANTVDGILGADFLKKSRALINYSNNTLIL